MESMVTISATEPLTNEQREERFFRQLQFNGLIRGGEVTPHWLRDGSSFWYAEGSPNHTIIYRVDPEARTRKPLFDVPRVREAVTLVLGHEPAGQGLPFDTFTLDAEEQVASFAVEGRDFRLRLETGELATPLISRSAAERARSTPWRVRAGRYAGPDVIELPSPDGRWLAGITDHNLSLRSTLDGRVEVLTDDGIEDYGWDIVNATETPNASWSPDSLRLAAIKLDQRRVLRFPIVHWLKTAEEIEWGRYAKAGGPIAQTELYLVDIYRRLPVRVDLGDEPDQMIRPIGWLPDGSGFLYLRLARGLNPITLCIANPVTGASREIVQEKVGTFINYADVEVICTVLPQRRQVIWRSERNGWAHLYLYSLEGQLLRRLTDGEFPVRRVVHVDEDAGWIYFLAQAEPRIYDTHLYRVNLDGEGFQRLTEDEGQHSAVASPSGKYILDTHSSHARPPAVDLCSADGEQIRRLSAADLAALDGLYTQPPEEFTALADDGVTELHGLLFLPPDFDAAKKYPVLDSIYGGPQGAVVPRVYTDAFLAPAARAYAQDGFVVCIVDGRGTPGRSKAFHDVIHNNWGRYVIPDHVAVLRQLAAERPYMDLERLGIYGISWGGYNTIRAMVMAQDVYRVGVAANPVADLYDHIDFAIEPFMGLPQENREAYEYASSLRLAGNLKGKLLLIASTSDVNAPFSSTIQFCHALMQAGKLYDLVILAEEIHIPQGTAAAYYLKAQRHYLIEHLQPRSGTRARASC
jgi:dipeptidyl aminopeptidase/acylaminoacyl peptidase